jgi:hypothetical protein
MAMLPFPRVYKATAEHLDFVSPHLYPKTGKVDDEIKLLAQFYRGKPVVIGETFPFDLVADECVSGASRSPSPFVIKTS